MGAMIGLAVGYVLGSRAGEKGYSELEEAWATISSSEEVKEMLLGTLTLARDLARRGRYLLAERLQEPGAGALRPVA